MRVHQEDLSPTKVKLTITADQAMIDASKEEALRHLSQDHVKIQGFRQGKAPLNLVEKQVSPALLQEEFLERIVNRLYLEAINHQGLRPVSPPQVALSKFVPFSTLELTAEVEVVGQVTLPDYKKIKLAKPEVKIASKDVDEVIASLRGRMAERKPLERAAKDGDEVTLDFKGSDAKTKEPIAGADGKDYPLVLGSDTFIPGFESNLVGMKAGDKKSFELSFPKDYGVKALQNRKVKFDVEVKRVAEMVLPKLDDTLAAKVGQFKTVAELKADIKKELTRERSTQAERQYESDLLENIAKKIKVAVPDVLIDEEVERQIQSDKQNAAYRGQTWQEYLKSLSTTEEKLREELRPNAELRVKAGLALSEIAEKEKIEVTPEELEMRLQLMKGQYTDAAIQAELDKPETRREIASRLLSEKTINKLTSYASK